MKTMLLCMDDVRSSLSMAAVIEAVEEGYLAFEEGESTAARHRINGDAGHHGETDIKSCYNALNESVSVKIASGFYDNGKTNDLPTMIGTILLFDGRTGASVCIMDGSLITAIRTGAAGAISSKLLARKDSKQSRFLAEAVRPECRSTDYVR